MAYWMEHSLGIAPQVSGFGTPNTADADYKWIQGDKPKVQFATEIVELELMTGQIGAAPERLVGRRHGTVSLSMPLEGLKSGYDPTGENPGDAGVVPPWMCLVGNALGSYITNTVDTAAKFWRGDHLSTSTYVANGMASGTASTIVCDADPTTMSVGELIAAATSATGTTVQFGFIKTKNTGTKTLTLFEDAQHNVNDNGAELFGSANAWISPVHSSQLPVTMRWVGEQTTAAYYLKDCICTGFKITWEAGAVPTLEMSFNFYDYTVDKTKGGLQVPAAFQRIPQIVGTNNGWATVAGAETCGLEQCSIEYKCEIAEVKCHSATQGIEAVIYKKPRINVAVSVPWSSSDPVYDAAGGAGNTGSHKWQSYLERGVTVSLGCYVGSNIGKLFAFLVTAGKLVAVAQVTDLNGNVGYQLTVEAGAYTGDSTDTAETSTTSPLDSIFRISIA